MKIEIDDTALYVDIDSENYHFLNFNVFYSFISDILTKTQFDKYISEDDARIFTVNDNKFKKLINELIEKDKVKILS